MADKLEYIKFEERLDFAMSLLIKKFDITKVDQEVFMREACEIARTLFVRSEIAYSGKKA